jgi:glycosyltransferase involved in cell wall biosynthesis
MRILHVTPYYAPAYAFGGVVRSAEGMARALARRGHQVTVLTTDALSSDSRYKGPRDELRDGVQVLRARNLSVWLRSKVNLGTPLGMGRVVREVLHDVDVVHLHEFRTVENLLVLPTVKQPVVLSAHGTLNLTTGRPLIKRVWDGLFSACMAGRINQIICLSDAELAEVQSVWSAYGWKLPKLGLVRIPNGVDLAEFATLPDGREFREQHNLGDGPICLYMGRLHPRKGVDLLIEAFKAADVPGARLVIAGPDEGLLERLRGLADERVIFTGYLGGQQRLAALGAADCFALPAVGEGLPMGVLEAMAAGLPVLLTPGCNLPEVGETGAGLIVERETGPLAEALRRLLTDADLRRRMGAAAKRLVAERFTWDVVAGELEQVYGELKTEAKEDGD